MKVEAAASQSFQIEYEDGPTTRIAVALRADARPSIAVRPVWPATDGARVADGGYGCGIGVVSGDVAVYPTLLGAEVTAGLEDAVGLPPSIEISLRLPDGSWSGLDLTDEILALDIEDLVTIRDGCIPSVLAPAVTIPHIDADLAGAISFYFGRMPEFDAEGCRVSREISAADLEQARIVRRWSHPAPEAEFRPTLSPSV